MLLVRALNTGGAQRQVVTLAAGLQKSGWAVVVCSFYSFGDFASDLKEAGVTLHFLSKKGRWDIFGFFVRLLGCIRRERPDILHSYLGGPNLVAILARVVFPKMRVVWGVRDSNMELSRYGWAMRFCFLMERLFSGSVDLIISNSEAGKRVRILEGFTADRMRVIPNGVDTEKFKYNATERERMRREWNVPATAVLVGLVARLDPMKDHKNFLEAACLLATRGAQWHFVCVGMGTGADSKALIGSDEALHLGARLRWVRECRDMAAAYSALDILACSSAFGEGFSNAIAEAMACGCPCVATNVGDASRIIGDAGVVVPPRDPESLSRGIEALALRLSQEGRGLRELARQRIAVDFGVEKLVDRTSREICALVPSWRG